jgi:hypothetical protein
MKQPTWQVRIRYREPGYELRTGVARLYSGTFIVGADSAATAERFARAQFRETEELSDSEWVREVASVEISPIESGAEANC